jgi:energy-coupling factor transport system permease protein
LIIYCLLFLGVVFTPNFYGLGLSAIIVLLLYFLAKLPIQPTWLNFKRGFPLLLILAVLQIVLGTTIDSDVVLGSLLNVAITQRGLTNAGMLIGRFSILIALLNAFSMSLSTSQMTAALFYLLKPLEKLRFPVNDLTMVVQITMRFLPLLALSAEKIAKAQAARGGDWEQRGFNPVRQAKRVLPLIVPLMVNSLKRAETMALAMESRGFNAVEKRSSYYALEYTWLDGISLLAALGLSVALILLV